jgi:hypothetical protein
LYFAPCPIRIAANDILPTKISGLRGKDIEGIKYTADKINAYSVEDTNAIFKEFESSIGEYNPIVTIIECDTAEPALIKQLQQIADRSNGSHELTQFLQIKDPYIHSDHLLERKSASVQTQAPTTSLAATSEQKDMVLPLAPTAQKPTPKKKKAKKISTCIQPQAAQELLSIAPTVPADFAPSDKAPKAQEPATLSPAIASALADILDGKTKKKKKYPEEVSVESHAQISIAPAIPHDKVVLQTESHVAIQDIAHNVLLHIYLPLNTGKQTIEHRRITYTDSIGQWFTNPKDALFAKGITDPHSTSYNPKYRSDLPIIDHMSLKHYCFVHNFSRLVDEFILARGIRQKEAPATYIQKGSEAVTLPGHIEYPNGAQESCSYCYIFSDIINAMCYHRNVVSQPRTWKTQQLWEKGYIPMLDPSQPSATML